MHWLKKLLQRSEKKQSRTWGSAEHCSTFSLHIWDRKLMDYSGLLVLLLALNLSGALCAVVQWAELNEAKVRWLYNLKPYQLTC